MRTLLQVSILPLAALLLGFREPPPTYLPCSPGSSESPLPLIDCNQNGIEDAVDIAFGTSSDADQNGIPDECERTRPAHPQVL